MPPILHSNPGDGNVCSQVMPPWRRHPVILPLCLSQIWRNTFGNTFGGCIWRMHLADVSNIVFGGCNWRMQFANALGGCIWQMHLAAILAIHLAIQMVEDFGILRSVTHRSGRRCLELRSALDPAFWHSRIRCCLS